jgi:ubiquinone/menaquinone biosynthesis C-methylase UbiE
MLNIARQRGARVCQAVGKRLPFRDKQFDFVLLVTVICFVDDVPFLFLEFNRVLKRGGHFIIGFINRNSALGRLYESRKETSAFYKGARFYSVEDVTSWVKEAGFGSSRFCQTLLSAPSEASTKNLEVREGCTDGAFVTLDEQKLSLVR